MTGRDLIIYILKNNLENEPVFKDGKLLGFKTVSEVAIENNVGKLTVDLWISLGMIPSIHLDEAVLVPSYYLAPLEKKTNA